MCKFETHMMQAQDCMGGGGIGYNRLAYKKHLQA